MFTQDALLLVGHGSTKLAGSVSPLEAHAEVIRTARRFAEVAVGAILGQPNLGAVFATLTAPVVHVLPFFMEDSYFTRIAIPDTLLPLGDVRDGALSDLQQELGSFAQQTANAFNAQNNQNAAFPRPSCSRKPNAFGNQ